MQAYEENFIMIVGCSSYTPDKEKYYKSILEWHTNVSMNVIRNHPTWFRNEYLLIDATSGPGVLCDIPGNSNHIDGSPLIALERLRQLNNWRAVFIERSPTVFKRLNAAIDQRCGVRDFRIDVKNRSYADYLREIKSDRKQIGLLYVDPNGLLDFEAIQLFSRKMPCMEILLSVGATSIKRVRNSPIMKDGREIDDFLSLKKYGLIRELYGAQQWTFLVLSNYELGFHKPDPKIELYPVDSDRGKAILDRAKYTWEELNEILQPTLPELRKEN